jgi:hypothetical protein
MMIHTCNPCFSAGRDWEDQFKANPWQKVSETLSQLIRWLWGYIPVFPVTEEAIGRRISV